MLPVSPEQLRPFPEPEWLPEPEGISLSGLLWLAIFFITVALLVLWAWQRRIRDATLAAILTLLQVRSGLEREFSDAANAVDAVLPPSDRLPAETSALDKLTCTLRHWLAARCGDSQPSLPARLVRYDLATKPSQPAAPSSEWAKVLPRCHLDTARPAANRQQQNLKRLEQLLAELEPWRFCGRPLPTRLLLHYLDEATAILTGSLCPTKQHG